MSAPNPQPLDARLPAAVNTEWWRRSAASPDAPAPAPNAGVDTDARLPFRMLLAFSFILLLAPQQAFPVLAPFRIAMLVIAGSVLAYMYARLIRGQPFFEMKPGIVPALAIAVWAVATVPASFWPGGSVAFLLGEYFKTLMLFLLLSQVIDSSRKLRTLTIGLVLMAMPLAFTTLQAWAAGSFNVNAGRILVSYNAPLTANPNDLALMMNLLLPFAIGLFLQARGKPLLRLAFGAAICIFVATVIITFSRAGFLTLALIFLIYMWRLRSRPERGWIPLALVLIMLSLPFVPSNYYDRLSTITNIEADTSGSAQTRWSDMFVAMELMVSSPIVGAGVGMNSFAMNEARGRLELEIHNVYLQYGVDLGLPGLILFLALFASCLRTAQDVIDRSARLPDPNGLFYLAEGIKVSLMAFALEAMFHPVAYNFYFYYIAGLAVALRTVCDREAGVT
jgi:O-antigen ligase